MAWFICAITAVIALAPSYAVLGCEDSSVACSIWAEHGECLNNPSYMLKHCALSCKTCSPIDLEIDEGGSIDPQLVESIYGNVVKQRQSSLDSGTRNSFLDSETDLPAGRLVKYFFYTHPVPSEQDANLTLQIWRPVSETEYKHRLLWQKSLVLLLNKGALYTYTLAETVILEESDRIGWQNGQSLVPISFNYQEGHGTYFRTIDGDDPVVGGNYYFDSVHLPSVFSVAVEVYTNETNRVDTSTVTLTETTSPESGSEGIIVSSSAPEHQTYGEETSTATIAVTDSTILQRGTTDVTSTTQEDTTDGVDDDVTSTTQEDTTGGVDDDEDDDGDDETAQLAVGASLGILLALLLIGVLILYVRRRYQKTTRFDLTEQHVNHRSNPTIVYTSGMGNEAVGSDVPYDTLSEESGPPPSEKGLFA